MIDLQFFGRGAGFNPALGNTNAWFRLDNHLVMLDCGESTFAAVSRYPGLKGLDSVTVLLTHMHADHVGSLASLCSFNYFVLGRKVLVVHPVQAVQQLLRLQGIGDEVYNWSPSWPAHLPVQVEAHKVRHVPDMQCFAYNIGDADEQIYYSGDSAEFPARVAQGLESGHYARVYHDMASHESATHCPVWDVEAAVPAALRKRVWAMHLDGDCLEDFRSRGFSVVGDV